MDENQRTDVMFGGDGGAGEGLQCWICGEGSDGDESDVGSAASECIGTCGGKHPIELVALEQRAGKRRVCEVPHERGWIEKADGGDASSIVGCQATLILTRLESEVCARSESGCQLDGVVA